MCTNLRKFLAQSEQILTYKSLSRDRTSSSPETNKWVHQLAKGANPSSLKMIVAQEPINTYKTPTCLATGTKLVYPSNAPETNNRYIN